MLVKLTPGHLSTVFGRVSTSNSYIHFTESYFAFDELTFSQFNCIYLQTAIILQITFRQKSTNDKSCILNNKKLLVKC